MTFFRYWKFAYLKQIFTGIMFLASFQLVLSNRWGMFSISKVHSLLIQFSKESIKIEPINVTHWYMCHEIRMNFILLSSLFLFTPTFQEIWKHQMRKHFPKACFLLKSKKRMQLLKLPVILEVFKYDFHAKSFMICYTWMLWKRSCKAFKCKFKHKRLHGRLYRIANWYFFILK